MCDMTSRERLLTALRHGIPDRVPVSPDVSAMMPARYTGRPFWDIFLNADPPLWQAHLELQKRFGYDMIMDVGLGAGPDDPPSTTRVVSRNDEEWVAETRISTAHGDLTTRSVYPRSTSPWVVKPMITDPEAEVPALLATLKDPWRKDASHAEQVRSAVGDNGILAAGTAVPPAWWLYSRRQLDRAILDFFDRTALVEKVMDAFSEWALEWLKATCEMVRPDLIMFGGSVSSMSVLSPDLYRRYALPFLRRAASVARSYGVFTGVHMCGRCRAALPILAEAGIDLIEPLETDPGGDVTLAEVKQAYGARFCLKGNVNTFETLARGTPEQVVTAAGRCIEDAAEGGGFILSTGDQVAGDTPEENFVALIRTAAERGSYAVAS